MAFLEAEAPPSPADSGSTRPKSQMEKGRAAGSNAQATSPATAQAREGPEAAIRGYIRDDAALGRRDDDAAAS